MNNSDEPMLYSVEQDDLVGDLIASLGAQDIATLHAKLKALGISGWWDFLSKNSAACERYISASSAQRGRIAARENTEWPLIVYGAIWLAQLSGSLGYLFDDPVLQGRPHLRETRAARGRLLWAAYLAPVVEWPFDEPIDLDNPFDA